MMNLKKKVDPRQEQLEMIKEKNRHLLALRTPPKEVSTFKLVPEKMKALSLADYARIGTGVYSIVTAGITIKRIFSPSADAVADSPNVWTFLNSYSGRHAVKVVAGTIERIAT